MAMKLAKPQHFVLVHRCSGVPQDVIEKFGLRDVRTKAIEAKLTSLSQDRAGWGTPGVVGPSLRSSSGKMFLKVGCWIVVVCFLLFFLVVVAVSAVVLYLLWLRIKVSEQQIRSLWQFVTERYCCCCFLLAKKEGHTLWIWKFEWLPLNA